MTSRSDFTRFKREALRLIDKLGLKGWRVIFLHEKLDGCYGDMYADHQGRIATIRYNKEPDSIAVPEDPERVARHEVLELFLARFEMLARSRFTLPDDIAEEKHAIIRTLENEL